MIGVSGVSYAAGEHAIVDNICVDIMPGRINILIGPNGAGKSTLLKLIAREIIPTRGEVLFNKKNIADFTLRELAKIRSFLLQQTAPSFPMTVRDMVLLGRYPHFTGKPSGKDYAACENALRLFGSDALSDRAYFSLSGGEQQRVQFARTLAQIWYPETQPRYLLLDEPLTFLDIYYQHDLMSKLREIVRQEDVTLFLTVHDLHIAAKYADELFLMNKGKMIDNGTVSSVLTAENIKEVYGVEAQITKGNTGVSICF